MSAGATPSDLMSETSALAVFAFAAMASPAIFSVFVTLRGYAGEVGRGVDAALARNLDSVVIGDVDQAIDRRGGSRGERRQDCDAKRICASWVPLWMETRVEKGAARNTERARLSQLDAWGQNVPGGLRLDPPPAPVAHSAPS
jgi:hypothetical protein